MVDTEEVRVLVKVFGGMRDMAPDAPLEISLVAPARFRDVLDAIRAAAPALYATLTEGLASGYVIALVNGRNALFLGGDDAALTGGETVAFLPPVGGG